MQVKLLFSYVENIVPPRCRNPRPVRFHDGELKVHIQEIGSLDAPVAIRGSGSLLRNPDLHYTLVYRWWKNQLWSPLRIDSGQPRGLTAGKEDWAYNRWPAALDLRTENAMVQSYEYDLSVCAHEGRHAIASYFKRAARSHVLIDGVPHRPAGEPRYVVMTFGLGRNHGGTACMVADYYNSNLRREAYFNLLEREQAIKYATEIATERGDTKCLPIKPHGPEWEILLPEALQVPLVAPSRYAKETQKRPQGVVQ